MYDNIPPGVQWTPGVRHKVKEDKHKNIEQSEKYRKYITATDIKDDHLRLFDVSVL